MDVEHDGIRMPVIQSSRKLEPSKVHAGASRHFPEFLILALTCLPIADFLP